MTLLRSSEMLGGERHAHIYNEILKLTPVDLENLFLKMRVCFNEN
jgi:hypothetical protein